jgi:hypothetical protein
VAPETGIAVAITFCCARTIRIVYLLKPLSSIDSVKEKVRLQNVSQKDTTLGETNADPELA